MPTLLEISADLQALDELLDELGGELETAEIEATIDRWLAELGDERDLKLDGYCRLVRECELRAAARKEESERLLLRVKADINKVNYLKQRLKDFMTLHGQKVIDTKHYRLSVCSNGGAVPVVVTCRAEELPPEYVLTEVVTRPNVGAIREALQAEKPVEHCSLGTRGTHLRIL